MAIETESHHTPEAQESEAGHTLEWIAAVLNDRSIDPDTARLYHIAETGLSREDLAYITHGLGLDISGDVMTVFDRIRDQADERTVEGVEELNRLIGELDEPVYLETDAEDIGLQRLAGFADGGDEILPVDRQGEIIEGTPFRLHYGERQIRQW